MLRSICTKGAAGLAAALMLSAASLDVNQAEAQGLPPETQSLLDTFIDVVNDNTDNENIIGLANRIVAICPQLTLQFDPGFDPANPDFDPSVDAGRESGTVQGDLVGRCTAAVEIANGAVAGLDPSEVIGVLAQIAGEETLGFDTAVSGITRTQTQVVASRVAAYTAGSPARMTVAQFQRPIILASNTYALPYQDNGMASDASSVSGAFSDESDLGGGWSGYATGYISYGEQNPTQLEAGFDFDSLALTVGADRAVGLQSMLGAAVTFSQTEVDFENNAGDTETTGISISGYGATSFTDNLSASVLASYGFIEHEGTRRIQYNDGRDQIDRTATGETDGNQLELTGTADYSWQNGELSWGPTARLSYIRQETDGYQETGAQGLDLIYDDQESTSLTAGVGMAAYYAISTSSGIIAPYGRIEWEHEFDDDARSFAVRYVGDTFASTGATPASLIQTDAPDRDRARASVGLAAQFAGGLSGFADYETVFGFDDVSAHSFAIGLRFEF